MPSSIKVTMTKERETKNKVRYSAPNEPVDTLYIDKQAVGGVDGGALPEKLVVTIEPGA